MHSYRPTLFASIDHAESLHLMPGLPKVIKQRDVSSVLNSYFSHQRTKEQLTDHASPTAISLWFACHGKQPDFPMSLPLFVQLKRKKWKS